MTQDGVVTQYTYDAMGSITQISEDGVVKRSYTYDAMNQLTSETRNGVTETYTYDNGGNILSRTRGGVTDTWSYESTLWKDLLTSYNGQAITYDEIGNPLSYRDGMTMTWEHGRQLSTLTKDGGSISYTYNADGIRTSKTVNGQTTEYILDGSTILGEKLPDGEYLYYLYDENGVRYGFARGSLLYYYVCNAQGDVVKILTSGGATAAWYEYDAWGNVVSIGGNAYVANLNPIRYRGYYYDAETGFYYLNSRYYDPEICRFVNADGYVSTGQGLLGNNMFAYCLNNPVINADYFGKWTLSISLGASAVATFFGIEGIIDLCWDSERNFAIMGTYFLSPDPSNNTMAFGTPSAFLGISIQITGEETLYELVGAGASGGAGFSVATAAIAIDGVFTDGPDGAATGMKVSAGIGSPSLDGHYVQTNTVIISDSPYEAYKEMQLISLVTRHRGGGKKNWVYVY